MRLLAVPLAPRSNAFFFLPLWVLLSSMAWSAAGREHIDAEAVAGAPFGVAVVRLPASNETGRAGVSSAFAVDGGGRAHYPAFVSGRLRKLLGAAFGLEADGTAAITVSFLFDGDAPFPVTIYAPQPYQFEIVPRRETRRVHERLLNHWWRDYLAAVKEQADNSDYEPFAQTYLTSMLSRRLQLALPVEPKEQPAGDLQRSLELVFGAEDARVAALRSAMRNGTPPAGNGGDSSSLEPAHLPLPPAIEWGLERHGEIATDVSLESIASHVPEECFYIRFGRFSNYVWLSRFMDEYAGGLASMITLRGVRDDGDARVQRQLALKESALGDLLGDAFISDVAILGRDLDLRRGAAIGMLFQARNSLLGANFQQERRRILEEERDHGATLETVRIGDHDVSFLSTPDHRVHSYYAIDGDYHLVTTSRAIVERFYEAGRGTRSLAQIAEFRHARTRLPLDRDDTVFLYFSRPFLRALVEPRYQVELSRRMTAEADMRILEMARWAARGESIDPDSADAMIAAGLLPAGFGLRSDGSKVTWTAQGAVDSRRGPRGAFLPIPDLPIDGITARESRDCLRQSAFYSRQWQQMDPLMVAVKRFSTPVDGQERLVIDAHISPLEEGKYGTLLSILGPPSRERMARAEGDVIHLQANVMGGLLNDTVPPHYLFLGVQDAVPLADPRPNGLLRTLRILQTTPGYLGAWPKPGFLDMLPLSLGGGRPDPQGYSSLLFGLGRRQIGDLALLSFDHRLLERIPPQLHLEPTDDAAQLRVELADLSRARLSTWVNALCFDRSWQSSLGNVRLLHALTQQFQIPDDQCLPVAESLVDGRLVCALGGQYAHRQLDRLTVWSSSAWAQEPTAYRAPLLDWFRGLDARLLKEPDRLIVHAELAIQRKPNEPKVELPLFDFLGRRKPEAAKPDAEQAPAPATSKKRTREF